MRAALLALAAAVLLPAPAAAQAESLSMHRSHAFAQHAQLRGSRDSAPPAIPPQPISLYCDGRIMADRFESQGIPGPQRRSRYLARLRNTHSAALQVVVLFTGDALDRPTGRPRRVPPGASWTVTLGHQVRRTGMPQMTPERLAQATRVSCR